MKSRFLIRACALVAVLGLITVAATFATMVLGPVSKLQALAVQDAVGGQGPGEGRMPLFGKITAIQSDSIEITNVDGQTVAVKLSGKTEFRKDRQPAKRTDFKVGDLIIIRGDENADHTWTAQVVAARSMNGSGRGGPGGGPGGRERGEFAQQAGTLGKDYVAGEIKSVDAPKLTVVRTDKVEQTIELNEDTSLRKGRDSVTMADLQSGDHIFARGAMQNDTFVPKTVVIIGPDQWKRMQEWGQGQGGERRRRPGELGTPPPAETQKPAEPQN